MIVKSPYVFKGTVVYSNSYTQVKNHNILNKQPSKHFVIILLWSHILFYILFHIKDISANPDKMWTHFDNHNHGPYF